MTGGQVSPTTLFGSLATIIPMQLILFDICNSPRAPEHPTLQEYHCQPETAEQFIKAGITIRDFLSSNPDALPLNSAEATSGEHLLITNSSRPILCLEGTGDTSRGLAENRRRRIRQTRDSEYTAQHLHNREKKMASRYETVRRFRRMGVILRRRRRRSRSLSRRG